MGSYLQKKFNQYLMTQLLQKGPLVNFTRYLRRKFYQRSYKLFREPEAERKLPHSFYEANITLVHYKANDITWIENY